MKKNLVFKLGLFCAALVLVANAWAKYTTSAATTDSARVAKFAVSLNGNQNENFKNFEFDVFTTKFDNIVQNTSKENKVDTTKIIAPGSYGSFDIIIDSDSEVAVHFDFIVESELNTNNIPLVWTLNGNEYDSLTEVFDAINGYAGYTDFAVGANDARTITIGWSWAYEVDDAGDSADTELGFVGNATYNLTFKIAATQVQPVPAA